jgi:hypothetical protein
VTFLSEQFRQGEIGGWLFAQDDGNPSVELGLPERFWFDDAEERATFQFAIGDGENKAEIQAVGSGSGFDVGNFSRVTAWDDIREPELHDSVSYNSLEARYTSSSVNDSFFSRAPRVRHLLARSLINLGMPLVF